MDRRCEKMFDIAINPKYLITDVSTPVTTLYICA